MMALNWEPLLADRRRPTLRPARGMQTIRLVMRLSICVVLTNSLRVGVLRGGAQKRGAAAKASLDEDEGAPPPQVFRFPDGSMYRGGVLDGMQHGEGEWRSAEGDVYVGGFARGAFEGRGRYKDARGNVFVGDFRAGGYHGAGTYLHADGRAECSQYEAGADRGEGARWSMDRARAWRLRDGTVEDEISLGEAAAIAARLGLVPPPGVYALSAEAEARLRARLRDEGADEAWAAARPLTLTLTLALALAPALL